MPTTIGRLALLKPITGDRVRKLREAIATNADKLGDAMTPSEFYLTGTRINRPAAGLAGRRYWCTDTFAEFADTGSAWQRVSQPAGTPTWFAGQANQIADGYVEASGQELSNTGIHRDIWLAIGTTHGGGGGGDKFLMPNLNGRTLIGRGTAAGITSRSLGAKVGAETHTLTTAEMPSHVHGYYQGLGAYAPRLPYNSGSFDTGIDQTDPAGGDAPHNNMQPSIVGIWALKL